MLRRSHDVIGPLDITANKLKEKHYQVRWATYGGRLRKNCKALSIFQVAVRHAIDIIKRIPLSLTRYVQLSV